MNEDFVGYVGPSDLHDATVRQIERVESSVTVFLESYEGRRFALRFWGVARVEANAPSPHRRFVFVHTEDGAPEMLEIVAEGFEVV